MEFLKSVWRHRMTYFLLCCLCATCVFACQARADVLPPCNTVELTAWTHASHPTGNPQNRFGVSKFNENNWGVGFKCYFQTKAGFATFYHAGALDNSRDGSTFTAGMGQQYDLFTIGPFTPFVGGALSAVYYQVKKRASYGPGQYELKTIGEIFVPIAPSYHYGVGVDLNQLFRMTGIKVSHRLGTLSFQENRLADGVRLRSIGWTYQF